MTKPLNITRSIPESMRNTGKQPLSVHKNGDKPATILVGGGAPMIQVGGGAPMVQVGGGAPIFTPEK